MLSAALLGFTLGLRHAMDPDHVAALAAMVARHGRIGVAARRPDVPLLAFVGGAAITLQALARFASVALDGTPHWRFLAAAVGELATGVFLLAVSRRV